MEEQSLHPIGTLAAILAFSAVVAAGATAASGHTINLLFGINSTMFIALAGVIAGVAGIARDEAKQLALVGTVVAGIVAVLSFL
jgi:hypothetical protein